MILKQRVVEQATAICTTLRQLRPAGTDYLTRSVCTACRRSKRAGTADVALQYLDGMGNSNEEVHCIFIDWLSFMLYQASFTLFLPAPSSFLQP